MKPRLVGLCGLAGSGKTTAAEFLATNGYKPLKFAGPLKAMTGALLKEVGLSRADILECLEGEYKEVPFQELQGKTPRHVMQTLGTEWGRGFMAEDFWLRIAESRAQQKMRRKGCVLFDDLRFENEAEMIRKNGGTVIKLVRGESRAAAHASESLDFEADITIDNTGTIKDLHANLIAALSL